MTDHAKTILRWAAKGVRIEDVKASLALYGVTGREVDDVLKNATRQQVKQAQATPEFLEPHLFE